MQVIVVRVAHFWNARVTMHMLVEVRVSGGKRQAVISVPQFYT